jgi:hypothetical protein
LERSLGRSASEVPASSSEMGRPDSLIDLYLAC